jgi:hypothetical protein
VKDSQFSAGRDFESRPINVAAAIGGRSVEIAIAALRNDAVIHWEEWIAGDEAEVVEHSVGLSVKRRCACGQHKGK